MRSWRSYLLLAIALVAMWLLLNQTLALAHWLLGTAIALAAVCGYALLRPPPAPMRRAGLAAALACVVFADIVRSNLAVARIVTGTGGSNRTAGFVEIPLELRSAAGLAALGCIITATPGTAWAGYDSARGVLTMHILDLIDERTWIRIVQQRYERRLLEIFP